MPDTKYQHQIRGRKGSEIKMQQNKKNKEENEA